MNSPRLPPKKRTPEERRAALVPDEAKRVPELKWSPKCGTCWYSRCGRYMIHHNPAGFPRGYHLVARSIDGDGVQTDGSDQGRWNFWGHQHHTDKFDRLGDAKDGAEDLAEVGDD